MSNDQDSNLDKIKEEYDFIANSVFYKIYKEFDISCTGYNTDHNASCPPSTLDSASTSTNVINLLKELYSNFYRVNITCQGHNNDYFDLNLEEAKKIGCACLKYWLYDQIITKGLNESEIKDLFNGYNNHINGKINDIRVYNCNFNELVLNDIKNLKKIYTLNTFLHTYVTNFNKCNSNSCKYMEYFGEGLDEFIISVNRCVSNPNLTNYCNEFNEFLNLCKDGNEYAGIIYDENKKNPADTSMKYLFSVETYEKKPLYLYVKNKEMLNFVKNSHFLNSQYRTTIAATSVVGSAIGLSSIFYYFYKVNLKDIFKYKYFTIINIKYVSKDLL
ncbi:hypothetical protein PVMG_05124 [Plasmodium vivax Mauritania I]|uniref:VIR protein n=1 Tax=Plasmodium vivax Mauritania I TaxID=1035515 RepID=A0A0J9TJC1_PLAVI|nr:hypothetical protein PVMG_05124 [Plasmodium vivax Mauritania I]